VCVLRLLVLRCLFGDLVGVVILVARGTTTLLILTQNRLAAYGSIGGQ